MSKKILVAYFSASGGLQRQHGNFQKRQEQTCMRLSQRYRTAVLIRTGQIKKSQQCGDERFDIPS